MKTTKSPKPRPNRTGWPTSLTLTHEQRDRLRKIQEETGVPISVTVRRLLDRCLPSTGEGA